MGEPILADHVVPTGVSRRDGAAAIRVEKRDQARARCRQQCEADGVGRGRLSCRKREAHGAISRIRYLNKIVVREDSMIQVGIFTGYFPYGLEETATKIRKHGFNTVQLDVTFKDMDLDTDKI